METNTSLSKLYREKKFGELERSLREAPPRIAELGPLLGEGDGESVCALLQVLGRVGFDYTEESGPLLGQVLALMGNADPFIRMDAAYVFGTIASSSRLPAEKAMPLLHELLADENSLVRGDAAGAIGNIGFYHPDLVGGEVDRLLAMMDAGDDDEREATAHALGKIGATNPDLLRQIFPRLVRALEKTREASCGGILLAFGTVGMHFPKMVEKYIPRLIEYLGSPNQDTVRYAVLALGNIATSRPDIVKEAVPHLRRLTKVSDHDLRVNAQMALSMMGAQA